jgi:hypothetical protein
MRLQLLLLSLTISASTAYCGTVAITSLANDSIAGHSNYDIAGFQFSNADSIDVTSLGMWVSGASLVDTHAIGVYDLAGNLQFYDTVNSGATPDASGFTWVNLSGSHTLSAGSWFIGVQYNQGSGDQMYAGYGTITMAPGLTFLEASVYYSGAPVSLTNPAGTAGHYSEGLPRASYIGPNFTFDAAATATPEPGTWGMLVIGAAGFALRLRGSRLTGKFRLG